MTKNDKNGINDINDINDKNDKEKNKETERQRDRESGPAAKYFSGFHYFLPLNNLI